jgi:hypothetical protein
MLPKLEGEEGVQYLIGLKCENVVKEAGANTW